MLHALRGRAREDRDAGFTLIEILVAMVLMAIVMSSLAVFFIGAQKSSSALRMRQSATVVADAAMDNVHAIDVTKILLGRDKTSSDAQWATPPVGVDLTSMTELYDTSTPAPASGFGATLSTDPTAPAMGLPTVPEIRKVNGTPFNVSYLIGQCFVPDGGGACTKTGAATSVRMDRIVVAVNWTIKGLACPLHICAYVIGSLLSPVGDPTFNVNQVLIDTTPPTIPTLNSCTQLTDTTEKLNAFSPSSDASGISRYDIYRGLAADFSTMTLISNQTTTSAYTDTGLVPSTDYYYAVEALDTVGNISGPQVPQGEVDVPQPPYMVGPCRTKDDTTPPTFASGAALTGTPSTNSILLSWPAATDDYKVQAYQIYRGGVLVATVPAPTLSYNDTGLSPWVTYPYKVVAVDPAGNLSTANNPTASVKTIDNVKPTVPAAFTAVVDAVTKTTMDLDWMDSTDDVAVTGYTVCRSLVPAMTSPSCATTTSSNYAFAGLTTNTHYWFTVSAYDGAGNTSSVASANMTTPDTQAPSVPAGLTSTGKTGSAVSLSWTAATDNVGGTGVAGYRIYRNGSQVGTSATTSFTDTGLTDLTGYVYTVSAYDGAGNSSGQSSPISVTTLDGTPPTAPSLSSSAQSFTSITVNWTAATDNLGVTGYALYEDGGTTPITTTGNSTFSFLDTGEAPGTAHTYVVKAFDAAGNYSVASNTLPVSTNADVTPPGTPNLAKGTLTSTSVVLNWGVVGDNVGVAGYAVYEDGGTTPITTTTATTFTDSGESPGTTHTYTVKAYDASGNYSAASNVVTVSFPLDPAAPTAVTLTGTSPGSNQATITWGTSTSTPTAVNGYKVYVNGVLNTTKAATVHSLTYGGLGNSSTYTFYIVATNTAGKSSPPSNTLTCVVTNTGSVTCS